MVAQLFVFGYGSLVSRSSVRDTLGYDFDPGKFAYAQLDGWARSWNVGSSRESHPERTFHLPDGSVFDGVTVVLGITEDESAKCSGAVFPVSGPDLRRLDRRERNYVRTDVTGRVTWAGRPAGCVVHTYVPRPEAVARIAAARSAGRPVNVRQGYADLVEAAFEHLRRNGSDATIALPEGTPVQAMQSRIDHRRA